MARLISVSEAQFSRHVLAAPMPVLVLFGKRGCSATRAMVALLTHLAVVYTEQLRIVKVNVDTAPFVVEQYGIWATPTLMVFQQGEVLTRVVGFLSEGLLRVLAEQATHDELGANTWWSPVEEVFENTVLIPLLEQWGVRYRRQVVCSRPSGTQQGRGRVDILLYDHATTQPISLIESKRLIVSNHDLQQAVRQANAYAQALCLRSFSVAAPSGVWIFQRNGTKATCIQTFTSLELHNTPELVHPFLRGLQQGYSSPSPDS